MEKTDGYKRGDVQKVSARRFEISKILNSNDGDGQNESIRKLATSYSEQLKLGGGERGKDGEDHRGETGKNRRRRRRRRKRRRRPQRRRRGKRRR